MAAQMKWPVRMSGMVATLSTRPPTVRAFGRDAAAVDKAPGQRHDGLADAGRIGVFEAHASRRSSGARVDTAMASGTACGATP